MHRIFIVEDDAAIAAALQKHLTTWGFDVRTLWRYNSSTNQKG